MSQTLSEEDVLAGLSGSNRDWAYNALDCCITRGIQPKLAALMAKDPLWAAIYRFEMACQTWAFVMMLRGAAFDERACAHAIKDWEKEEEHLIASLNDLVAPIWDRTEQRKGKCADGKPHAWNNAKNRKVEERVDCDDGAAYCCKCKLLRLVPSHFNPISSAQVIKLIYERLSLPKQHSRKGDRNVTADDEALFKLIHHKKTGEEQAGVLQAILSVRKARKQIGFLKSRRSSDGRLRQSVNVGATETGRWSASKDPFREGTNFQNIADRSRHVIVTDPGLWLAYADLEQAESRIVAFDAEDEDYINAHDSGDVHTFVATMVWPDLPWPGDPKGDRQVAEQPTAWDPDHSYRDYAKHVQHGGNIGQTPFGMARDAHIPVKAAEDVYERMYGQAFPGVRRRQKEIMAQVQETGVLVTPLGRKRQFFGRLWEPATQREGLAQTQQSSVADILNLAICRIGNELDNPFPNLTRGPRPGDPNKIWLLAQIHDAILFLLRPHDITTLERVIELMRIPVPIRGRVCTIGVDVQLGSNFRHFNPKKAETIGGLSSWHKEGNRIVIHNTKEYLK